MICLSAGDTKREDLIAESVLKHLNAWPDKPCKIQLEKLDKSPSGFSMSMQRLSGTVISRKYIDGSFVGLWPFAVYVRTSAVDTSKHLEAAGHLSSLNAWLRSTLLPELSGSQTASSFEMTSLPAIAGVYEDGNVDYQAVFQLKYHQRSE